MKEVQVPERREVPWAVLWWEGGGGECTAQLPRVAYIYYRSRGVTGHLLRGWHADPPPPPPPTVKKVRGNI